MRILILWNGLRRRDLGQENIYYELGKRYDIIYTTPDTYLFDVQNIDYDVLWLDIYHCVLNIDWECFVNVIKKPVIFDQADNEYYVNKMNVFIDVISKLSSGGVITSRYLPNNIIEEYGGKINLPVKQLSWCYDDDFIKKKSFIDKDIDVSFLCSLNTPLRKKIREEIIEVCDERKIKYMVGDYWGDDYYNILLRSKTFFVSSERKALTQKYFEAILCGCTIIGDVPIYPHNNLKIHGFNYDFNSLGDLIEHAVKTPLNNVIENKFHFEFCEILKELKLDEKSLLL